MSYKTYLLSPANPGLREHREHRGIFIETEVNGPRTGCLYYVKGSLQTGMSFDYRDEMEPEKNFDIARKDFLGFIKKEDFDSEKVKECCESVAAPKKQFEGSERLYPEEELRRCTEWCTEAIEELTKEGLLRWEDEK